MRPWKCWDKERLAGFCREVEENLENEGFVAVKVIKNRPAYFNQPHGAAHFAHAAAEGPWKAKQLIVELRRHFTFKIILLRLRPLIHQFIRPLRQNH